jgi:protein TonB
MGHDNQAPGRMASGVLPMLYPQNRPLSSPAPIFIVGVLALLLGAVTGCTVTPPPKPVAGATAAVPSPRLNTAALEQYRLHVAQRILERSPSAVLHGTPQAMLRSVVLIAFAVDGDGQLASSSIYRSNGDSGAERIALAALRRAVPLPRPPPDLLDGRGYLELLEDWLFNNNGKFQLREFASPQATTID